MTLAIALYFFLISAVMLGLMAVSLPFYKATNAVRPSNLWAVTLGLNGLGTFLFAFSITLITDVENPPLLNTVANSFILGAHFCLALFFRTLRRPTDQAASYPILWGFMAAFGIGYEVFNYNLLSRKVLRALDFWQRSSCFGSVLSCLGMQSSGPRITSRCS
jgi:hypothetical protein